MKQDVTKWQVSKNSYYVARAIPTNHDDTPSGEGREATKVTSGNLVCQEE